MTDSDLSGNRISEAVRQALRNITDRITRDEEVGLSADEQLALLRLTHELEQTRYALERAEIELAAKSEQLQIVSRELEASRSEYWGVTDLIPAAFIVLDKKGIVTRANAHAKQMLAGDFRPLIGLAFSSFVAPEDLGVYLRQIKITSSDRKKAYSFELRMKDFAGRIIHTYGQGSAIFDAESNLLHWHLAFFDISEQKRLEEALSVSQEYLALATSAGNIGIWIIDLETGKSHWSEQLYHLLGLEPQEGPEDWQSLFAFIHPDDRRSVLDNTQSLLALGKTINLEFRIIRSDNGQVRWLASRGTIDRDAHGTPSRMQGVSFDITYRKVAEETQRLAQLRMAEQLDETERINKELSQFAYAVTHDLKAPLRAIANYSEFLYQDLADSLTGDQIDYLKGLKKAVAQGDALINDLLSFSRIGRVSPESEAINVPGLVKEIGFLLNLPPEVEIEVQPQWPEIWADYTLLKQILQNLISNSIKFNKRNPKRIEIGWQAAPNEHIEIFVRDNGIGIAPEYYQKIFEIFRRLHTEKEYEGTGIGLAIVQKAAQNLGGSVRVESTPGEGSTFIIKLGNSVLNIENHKNAPDG